MLEESSRDHYIDVATRRAALDALGPNLQKKGAAFLDAGCSTGWLLDDVQRKYPAARIVGADAFTSGLQKALARCRDSRVVQFNLLDAPFKSQSFDAISCLSVLEHIEEDARALKEIRRLLKPDGSAFLLVPAGRRLYDYYDEVHYHVRRYEKQEFRDKLIEAGYSIRRLFYMGIILFPAFYMVKKYGQWKMRGKTFEEKKEQVKKDVGLKQKSVLAAASLSLERKLGQLLPQPFGIRLCAHVSPRVFS